MGIERIDSVINGFIHKTREGTSEIFQLQGEWRDLVGEVLANHTQPVAIRNEKLTIRVSENAAGFALRYEYPNLLEQIEHRTGIHLKDIIFQAGRIDRNASS